MAIIPLGVEDIQSKDETVSRLQMENMYLVDSPFSPDNISRVSRPTLTKATILGPGPIYGMYAADGIFEGKWFVLSGTQVLMHDPVAVTTNNIGTVPGTSYCLFAAASVSGSAAVFLLRDGLLYAYDGTNFGQVTIPDNTLVGSMAYIDGYLVFSVYGDDNKIGRFYWIEPGSVTVDPLNFATAERVPDNLVSVSVIGDEVWFIGRSSLEVWATTGDKDAPFQRIAGRAYSYGCADPLTTVNLNVDGFPSLLWVTNTRVVVQGQANPIKISNEVVDEALRSSIFLKAFGFEYQRHSFYIIHCDDATFAYDCNKKNWTRWSSYNRDDWRVKTGVQINSTILVGDDTDSRIYTLDSGTDDDGDPIVRIVTGLLSLQEPAYSCNRVDVYMNVGNTVNYQASSVLELAWSDDLGSTYSDFISTEIGDTGQYGTLVYFLSLGQMRRPGRVFKFRFSDKARFRLDYATVNEKR